MDIHPLTNHEIAHLRREERLRRGHAARRALDVRGEQRDAGAPEHRRSARLSWKWVVLLFSGVFLAAAPAALAHPTKWAWTEAKAERIVRADVTVMLPATERASLEEELRASAAYFGGLAMAASEERDGASASVYEDLTYRFRAALRKVRAGLAIAGAECAGSGAALKGKRFKHFRCSVTSELLQIPNVTIMNSDGSDLPQVVAGEPRTVGPVEAQLDVHVTGQSTIVARRLS